MIDKKLFLDVIDSAPLVSIDLILRDAEGNVLLGKRNNRPAQGSWFVPGGRIRKNETIVDAFNRIVSTELGINLPFEKAVLMGVYDHIYDDNCFAVAQINTHYVVLAYSIELDSEVVLTADEQHAAFKFWQIDDLIQEAAVHQNTKNYFL